MTSKYPAREHAPDDAGRYVCTECSGERQVDAQEWGTQPCPRCADTDGHEPCEHCGKTAVHCIDRVYLCDPCKVETDPDPVAARLAAVVLAAFVMVAGTACGRSSAEPPRTEHQDSVPCIPVLPRHPTPDTTRVCIEVRR